MRYFASQAGDRQRRSKLSGWPGSLKAIRNLYIAKILVSVKLGPIEIGHEARPSSAASIICHAFKMQSTPQKSDRKSPDAFLAGDETTEVGGDSRFFRA